jgi:hydrogenase 3 maturation protease
MHGLKKTLKSKLFSAQKVAVLGIGSELCGDDAAGPLVSRYLTKKNTSRKNVLKFQVFPGGTAPENLTGEIKKFHPTHVIMVDAADMGQKPGKVVLIDSGRVSGVSFSTHRLPTTLIAEYLCRSISCQVILLGIQPKSLRFGKLPSTEVRRATQQLARLLLEVFEDIPCEPDSFCLTTTLKRGKNEDQGC